MGWIQYKKKEYKSAVKNLQRAVSIQPNSSEIMDHLGDCYYKMVVKKKLFYEWNRALVFDADDNLKQKIKEKLNYMKQINQGLNLFAPAKLNLNLEVLRKR